MRPTPSGLRGTMPKFDANGGPNALWSSPAFVDT